VSYAKKHNEANGEDNKDGMDDNRSQNGGVEGETSDPRVLARRRTIARSLLTTLFVSQGVPMLEMGDELWRTQRGNNNAYVHDSELAWVDWTMDDGKRAMLEQVRALAALRKSHPVFRRHEFLRGERVGGSRAKDITWLRTDGGEMTGEDWTDAKRAAIAFRLDGDCVDTSPARGEPVHDDSFLVLLNGAPEAVRFVLPPAALGERWRIVVDTREAANVGGVLRAGEGIALEGGAALVMTLVTSA
jgi:glycogen operon protein